MNPLLPLLAAPVDPSPDEARSWLRRELLKPEYHKTNPLAGLLRWLEDLFRSVSQAASQASPLVYFAALVLFVGLAVGIVWLVSRARMTRRAPREPGAVLEDTGLSAAEVRARAEAALAEGRHVEAVIDGFRALVLRQVERGRLEDVPGLTAHEVALALDASHPKERGRIDDAGLLFDLVRYGDRPATAEQARGVLTLDDDLAGVRR